MNYFYNIFSTQFNASKKDLSLYSQIKSKSDYLTQQ